MAARQGIVRTFQTMKLFGDMTVIEHVMVGMARHSRVGHVVRAASARALERGGQLNSAEARELIRFSASTASRRCPRTRSPTGIVACSKSPARSPFKPSHAAARRAGRRSGCRGDPRAGGGHPPAQERRG